MAKIIVELMPKAELLDPQGKAITGALHRGGHSRIQDVRVGKRFELTVDGPADSTALAEARSIAEEILSNQVIEDIVAVYAADSEGMPVTAAAGAEGNNG